MDGVLLTLALLACPVVMGAMMWMMMRGQGGNSGNEQRTSSQADQEVAELRAEVERLKSERAQRQARAGEH